MEEETAKLVRMEGLVETEDTSPLPYSMGLMDEEDDDHDDYQKDSLSSDVSFY